MSTDKTEKVEDILQHLKYAKKFNTWKEVGEYLGEKEATISIWRKRNSPSAPEKILYRCRGDVPERYLLTGEGPMSATGPTMKDLMLRQPHNPNDHAHNNTSPGPQISRRVPLISTVQAGAWAEVVDNLHPGDAEDWIDITSKVGPNTFALRVVGNSMEDEFREGEIIIVDPGREAVSGDYVVAKINSDEATFKQLLLDAGEVFLRPLNSAYPVIPVKNREFRVVGRVVEKVKRY